MSDMHALSGAYAVDALDELEQARFERHLAECAVCRAEVDELREAAALMAETSALEPDPALRVRVLSEIATVRPLPPHTGAAGPSAPHRRRWLAPLAAAAAVVAALGVGGTVWHPWTDDSSQAQPSAIQRVLRAADAQRVTKTVDGDGEATLVRSRSMNEAVLLTKNMPAPPAGKVYELWLQDPDKGMVPAGLMPDGATSVLLSGDAADAIGAGITVEPPGGSTVPTSDPVLLFRFENA
ncbi:anti-sigma factor [Nocardioides panaciterrulae]|uniref:Regulator of SigK n=1 Tax=Nocardioides panaciterrulae TaxID=661492 RepID=A0A7Y9E2T6_9ACTN|nr:anti-sigma factor [Nocardioides panaciterrulae]NYD40158.1 anti-sigma-K factor RskA [Nocardioides panaciterrulae]